MLFNRNLIVISFSNSNVEKAQTDKVILFLYLGLKQFNEF